MKRIDANSRTVRLSLLASDHTLFALRYDLAKLRQQRQSLMHDRLTDRVRVAGEVQPAS